MSAPGTFRYGIHQPAYRAVNLRTRTRIAPIGRTEDDATVDNQRNYPVGDVDVEAADWIYEIANPLPFRGATYIGKAWADRNAADYDRIRLPQPVSVSLSSLLAANGHDERFIERLPRPLQLALATTSSDPADLIRLARSCCSFLFDEAARPVGLRYRTTDRKPHIEDHDLFEAVANNPALPDDYKIAMVIRPGAQGDSEIVGDYHEGPTSIYEYLRRNSYIGGGHYAANMAEDAIRYAIRDLTATDINGLRHLYYQRSYLRLAAELGLKSAKPPLSSEDLETLRVSIIERIDSQRLTLNGTLWGWNFGFDFAPSGYRLHASHQQVHQQYAMIPGRIDEFSYGCSHRQGEYRPFACGDMITEAIDLYRRQHGRDYFIDYLRAIRTNRRMDERSDREADLIVWQDERALLFVPKAQTSQWELQIMVKPCADGRFPGNILESDTATRASLDTALIKGQQALAGRGARMVTTIEYAKPFDAEGSTQPLLYSLLPKLPQSPGAFSEAQLRFINGHYPEDFAAVCRQSLYETE